MLASACSPMSGSAGRIRRAAGDQGLHESLPATRSHHLRDSRTGGTNPASAQMAGLQAVVVKCDAMGNVDTSPTARQCEQHRIVSPA